MARTAASKRPRDADAFSDPSVVYDFLAGHDLISFDLFDTLVTRQIALQTVHRKTSEFADDFIRGDTGPLPKGLIANARHRLQDEVKARGIRASNGQRNEVDLADVFDAALQPYIRNHVARKTAVAGLIAYEVQTEIAILRVDPAMRDLLMQLRAAGRKLILISDMYFAAPHVEEILRALGLRDFFDHVFVSATVGVTKHSGKMFAHVDQTLKLQRSKRVHIGDNFHNDLHQPRRMGWRALHYWHPENETRREELEIRDRLGSAAHKAAFRTFGADYGISGEQGFERLTAAAFATFSRRVLRTAVQGRFDRVLFLTRDGTRFREGVQAYLQATSGSQAIACPPMGDLAISRRAGVLLNYPDMGAHNWQGFLESNVSWLNNTPLSIRTIMRTFSVSPSELKDLSPSILAEVAGYLVGDDPATDLGFHELKSRPKLLNALHQALVAKRERVRTYLQEQGLLDREERVLLVDIGYSGTALKSISEYFFAREAAGLPVKARLELMLLATNRFHGWNLGRMHPRVTLRHGELIGTEQGKHRAAGVNFSWLEPFAVDNLRGALRDYAPDASGKLQPIFSPATPDGAQKDLATRMIAHMAQYGHLLRQTPLSVAEVDKRIIDRWLGEVLRPGRATVRSVSALSHQTGIGEIVEQDMLRPISPLRLGSDIFRCIDGDGWLQGSLRTSRLALITPFVNLIAALEYK